ncbi:MAG: aldo/keto reductase [Clostridia bacterium]|nr:aldo/keto reductase [Clostridia bacterium]
MTGHEFKAFGRNVGAICLGTMNFGDTMDERTSFSVMDEFFQMGGNFIDTARVYGAFGPAGEGASEKVIGKWIKSRGVRNDIILATKGAHPPLNDMHSGRLDRKSIESDLNKSLDALGIGAIDLYWLHRDDESRDVLEILETLNGFVKQGLIRAFAASNWKASRLEKAAMEAEKNGLMGFCANQPMWSLAKNTLIEDDTLVQMDKETYAWHAKRRVACVPYTSQAKGFFIKLDKLGVEGLNEKVKKRYYNEHNLAIAGALGEICEKEGLSVASACVMYLTSQRDFDVYPIVGFSSVEQAKALKEASSKLLSDEAMQRLMKLSGLAREE